MTSAGRARYLRWKESHPGVIISHVIIEEDGDELGTQLDGNVYFDGTRTPDAFTIFGDIYISCLSGNDLKLGKFTIRGVMRFIIDRNRRVEFTGFEHLFRTNQRPLHPNVTVS
jgi:hypothetical protein